MVKNPPSSARDTGSVPDLVRSHMPQSNQAHMPRLLSLCSRGCPVTGEMMFFDSELPQDFLAMVEAWRKYSSASAGYMND